MQLTRAARYVESRSRKGRVQFNVITRSGKKTQNFAVAKLGKTTNGMVESEYVSDCDLQTLYTYVSYEI